MPTITDQTPEETYTIAGESFQIAQPYTEGSVLTAGEASQLNQVFAENIRNNLAAQVKALKEAGTFNAEQFQETVDAYVANYQMGVRTGGGGRTTDPVMAEAMEIARTLVRNAIKAKGIQLSSVPAAKVSELAKNAIASNPKILETAKARVAEAQSLASIDLANLGSTEAPAEAPKAKK